MRPDELIAYVLLGTPILCSVFIARKVFLVLQKRGSKAAMVYGIATFILTAAVFFTTIFLVLNSLDDGSYGRG
jgi:hypothetical protein